MTVQFPNGDLVEVTGARVFLQGRILIVQNGTVVVVQYTYPTLQAAQNALAAVSQAMLATPAVIITTVLWSTDGLNWQSPPVPSSSSFFLLQVLGAGLPTSGTIAIAWSNYPVSAAILPGGNSLQIQSYEFFEEPGYGSLGFIPAGNFDLQLFDSLGTQVASSTIQFS